MFVLMFAKHCIINVFLFRFMFRGVFLLCSFIIWNEIVWSPVTFLLNVALYFIVVIHCILAFFSSWIPWIGMVDCGNSCIVIALSQVYAQFWQLLKEIVKYNSMPTLQWIKISYLEYIKYLSSMCQIFITCSCILV